MQPLEVTDFSGGITDNILQTDPRRYAKADNFFITTDKKLLERWGINPFSDDGYFLPNAAESRVNGMYSFINESVFVAQSGRQLYTVYPGDTDWTEIKGLNNHVALQGGDEYSQTTYAEYQKQIYLTSDGYGQGINPSKIYRDENNIWVARTAGLPRAYGTGNYTTSSLLAACITLANDLRASMISHMQDALTPSFVTPGWGQTTASTLHLNVDKYSLSYLVSQSFNPAIDPEIPSPLPTPAPNATDTASLYNLVDALNNAYTHHMLDGMKLGGVTPLYVSGVNPYYHQDYQIISSYVAGPVAGPFITRARTVKGPGIRLTNAAKPDSLEEAAARLDDLAQKWLFHRKAIFTHSATNSPGQFDKYAVTSPKIGKIYLENSPPVVTPDYGDIYGYVNNLSYLWNYHVDADGGTSAGSHSFKSDVIPEYFLKYQLPEVSDLDNMYLSIFWLRALYSLHYIDATANDHITVQFSASAGSRNLTSVIRTDTGAAFTIPVGSILYWGLFGSVVPVGNQRGNRTGYGTAKITASGSGTATMDRPASASFGNSGAVTKSLFHGSASATGSFLTTLTNPEPSTSALGISETATGVDTKSWLTLADDLFGSMYQHMYNRPSHYILTQGSTVLVDQAPYQPFMLATVAEYVYAFYFSDSYIVEQNGVEYLTRGNPIFTDVIEAAISYPPGTIPPNNSTLYTQKAIITTRGNLISNLPVLVNDPSTNYNTTNVKLQIFRTTDTGTTFYKLDEVDNGTTSYLDTVNDTIDGADSAALNTRETMYTTGSVVGDDQPPQSKFIHSLNNYTYYGGVWDSGQFFPNRIRQTKELAPDAAPATFYVDLPDEVTGISSARSNLIAFCKASVYRLNGGFSSTGQGSITYEEISSEMGCVNAKSIVKTELGVFYAGTDGFYYTDGFQVIKISLEKDKSYKVFTSTDAQKRIIYGAYNKYQRTIYWAVKENEADTDNSKIFVFYLDCGVKPSGAFTELVNGLNFRPSSFVFRDGDIYMGHEQGAILRSFNYSKFDSVVDMATPAANWKRIYIPYNFTTGSMDMGTTFNRKYITKIHLLGENNGNMSIQMGALRDLNEYQKGSIPMAPVNYDINVRWDTATCVWGDSLALWEYDGKLDLWRRFPTRTLRSDTMQVTMSSTFNVVYSYAQNYPEFAFVTVDATAKTATIITPSGYTDIKFPLDVDGYYLKLNLDGYENSYLVTALSVNGHTITVTDPNNTLVDGTYEWELWGYKKEQRVKINSYVLHYAYLGDENQAYPGATVGSGAGNAGGNPR